MQVNSSGEPQKGGVDSHADAVALAQHLAAACRHLKLVGLMTIGNADYTAGPDNFAYLVESRRLVAEAVGVAPETLELSMGMSGDYKAAIEHGSTNVRIGSTIFGARG